MRSPLPVSHGRDLSVGRVRHVSHQSLPRHRLVRLARDPAFAQLEAERRSLEEKIARERLDLSQAMEIWCGSKSTRRINRLWQISISSGIGTPTGSIAEKAGDSGSVIGTSATSY